MIGNRRAHRRLNCRGSAEVDLFPQDRRLVCTVVDLSIGGVCLETEEPVLIEPGQRLEVLLYVKDSVIKLAGVLCHVRRCSYLGIQFRDVSARKAAQIKELMVELFGLNK
jgi:hypothetical protein